MQMSQEERDSVDWVMDELSRIIFEVEAWKHLDEITIRLDRSEDAMKLDSLLGDLT